MQPPVGAALLFEMLNVKGGDSIPLAAAVAAHGADAQLYLTAEVQKDIDGYWGITREVTLQHVCSIATEALTTVLVVHWV